MKPVQVRVAATVFAGALILCLPAFAAARQETKSPDQLTADQIESLAVSTLPADHQKLSRHFAALAARLDKDAATHEKLAKALRAEPNPSETKRPGAPDTAAHCERLASLARQAAAEARQLATVHEEMARTIR